MKPLTLFLFGIALLEAGIGGRGVAGDERDAEKKKR